jgi:hypothetical protein
VAVLSDYGQNVRWMIGYRHVELYQLQVCLLGGRYFVRETSITVAYSDLEGCP